LEMSLCLILPAKKIVLSEQPEELQSMLKQIKDVRQKKKHE